MKRKLQDFEEDEDAEFLPQDSKIKTDEEDLNDLSVEDQCAEDTEGDAEEEDEEEEDCLPIQLEVGGQLRVDEVPKVFNNCVVVSMVPYGDAGEKGREIAREISEVLQEYFQDRGEIEVVVHEEKERTGQLEQGFDTRQYKLKKLSQLLNIKESEIKEKIKPNCTFFRYSIDTIEFKFKKLMENIKKNQKWEEEWQKYALSHKFFILQQPLKNLFKLQYICEKKIEIVDMSLRQIILKWQNPEYLEWWEENEENILKDYQQRKGKNDGRILDQKC